MNPFKIEAPFVINFSGGRTSALMLRLILDAFGGRLPEDSRVVFCNTGREREETLKFVDDVAREWSVDIDWLEYRDRLIDCGDGTTIRKHSFERVSFATASRDGEPFSALIKRKRFLPNPVTRYCTTELKIQTTRRFLKSLGWAEWDSAIGIRYDEPRRWSKIRANRSGVKHDHPVMPLVDAKLAIGDVDRFWSGQSFRLDLMSHEGNCDLCFLKGRGKIQEIIERRPDLASWWIEQESNDFGTSVGPGLFRRDRPRYESMLKESETQGRLFDIDDSIGCFCGD